MWKWIMRIICLLFPIPVGFFVAIGLWIFKQDERADEALFFSFIGIFVSIVILLPLFLLLRFTLFAF
jgi:hypothetical protein